MKPFVIALILVVGSIAAMDRNAAAQVVQQSGTAQWTQPEAPAVAQTLLYTIYNSTVSAGGVLTPAALPATCVAAPAPVNGSACSAPLPTNMQPSIGGNYALCARLPNGVAMACTDTIGNNIPQRPTGLKIVISVIFQ